MLCCVMRCDVMLYCVMLCYVMLCCGMLCYVILCYVMWYSDMLCYVMIYYVIFCYVMLCYVMFWIVMSCYDTLCYVMLCYIMLYVVMFKYAFTMTYVTPCYSHQQLRIAVFIPVNTWSLLSYSVTKKLVYFRPSVCVSVRAYVSQCVCPFVSHVKKKNTQ